MKLQELGLSNDILQILKEEEIEELYPPQKKALPLALQGENLVLSVPTASGKSLVAYLAVVQRLLMEGGKALYVVPLRALAREKYEELKRFERLGLRVGISTGDLDDSDPRLFRYDIIVCTSEKADSLLRHGVSWVDKVKVLVIDEIHLIHDPSRGPTLEVIISRFKALNPTTQILGLSATIKNALDLAEWIDGELIKSDWRPVQLREGVCLRDTIKYEDSKMAELEGSARKPLQRLVEDSIVNGGQVLAFVNTRRSTVAVAKRLREIVPQYLNDEEKERLKEIVATLKHEQSEITSVGETLFSCIAKGVSFHNAGLQSIQRRTIERAFKDGLIKCIVATPTLAAGVNIPARRVVIRDLWRYDPNFGMQPIPILEYKQQAGRAGRPRYDEYGDAITIAKNEEKQEEIFHNYVLAETEPIFSKLGNKAALRMHILSTIAMNFADSREGVYNFVESTFYAYQSDVYALRGGVDDTVDFLLDNDFVEKIEGEKLIASLFGKKTSSLYIDPLSALTLRQALECSRDKPSSSLALIHAVCSTPDVRSLYLRSGDTWVEEVAEQREEGFLIEPPLVPSSDYEWFLSDLKTSLLVKDWIDEVSEDQIVSKFNVGPGDIHHIMETVEWLFHAAQELARMFNFECVSEVKDLGMRVQYGCKKELLNLVSLRGVGRVRARALFEEGFKTINDLRGVSIRRLAQVRTIGEGVAKNIKRQLGEHEVDEDKELTSYE